MNRTLTISIHLLLLVLSSATAQQVRILTQREQAIVVDDILDDRLRNLLPELMRREGFDMWIVMSREYNEDPVIRTMLPATWHAARRTTMLVMYDPGNGKEWEYLAVARYDVGKVFKRAWDPEHQPDQWAQLGKIISERNPKKIGVNKAPYYGHADGLTSNDYDHLIKCIDPKLQSRVTSAERLAVSWLESYFFATRVADTASQDLAVGHRELLLRAVVYLRQRSLDAAD